MRKFSKALICIMLLAGILSAGVSACAGSDELCIHVFELGKADAYLISAGDSAVLIDCGESGAGKLIVQYLKQQGIRSLDCLILTHFDKDHVGGAAKLLKSFPVERVLQSNSQKNSKEMEKYLRALDLTDIEPETVTVALSFSLGGAEFTVYPPQKEDYEKDPSNNSSLVTSVKFGENSFLFTGDSESARLAEVLGLDLGKYDFLQIPHHGEWDMLLVSLVRATDPFLAVITSSEEEPEDKRTLQLLEQEGVEVLLSRAGELDIVSDGTEISVTQNGEPVNFLAPAA